MNCAESAADRNPSLSRAHAFIQNVSGRVDLTKITLSWVRKAAGAFPPRTKKIESIDPSALESAADNAHNTEFVELLSRDPNFQGPFQFKVGRFAPIDVVVFVKKEMPCH